MSAHEETELGEGAENRSARRIAYRLMKDLLEFSTYRYYAVGIEPIAVESSGDVLVTLTLRVPSWEIEREVWEADRILRAKLAR